MSTQTEPGRKALGAELKSARERRGLSLHQASQELHIGDFILDALERGDYSTLGAPIFVRGHLRAYARLLGLGEEDVLARYEQESDKPVPPPLVTQKLDGGMHRASTRIFSLLVIVVLCVLTVAWWMHRERPAPLKVAKTIAPTAGTTSAPLPAPPQTSLQVVRPEAIAMKKPPAVVERHAAQQPGQQPAASPQRNVTRPVELPPAAAAHIAATATTKSVTPTAVGGQALTHVAFVLNQASWIEVYDASGKRLYYDLAPAGESVSVSGAGPLQVFLGNAPGVSIQLDGAKFDQTPYTRADNTARFRLGGAQSDSGQAG